MEGPSYHTLGSYTSIKNMVVWSKTLFTSGDISRSATDARQANDKARDTE